MAIDSPGRPQVIELLSAYLFTILDCGRVCWSGKGVFELCGLDAGGMSWAMLVLQCK